MIMYHTIFDKEKKLWSGQMNSTDFNNEELLGNIILDSLKTHGPRVAQVNQKINL